MKIDVIANAAIARGIPIAFPMNTPTTHDAVHEDWEHRFTSVARATDQPPCSNILVLTPKLSSVTVAANKKERRLETPSHHGANAAEYSIWRVLTNETLAMMDAMGDPASHMFGIMNWPAPE